MGITNVKVWIEVKAEDEVLDVMEQVADLIENNIVRRGVQLRGVTQERPEAACGLTCEDPRKLSGIIVGEPKEDIYVLTPGGEKVGIVQFLKQDGTIEGQSVTIQSRP